MKTALLALLCCSSSIVLWSQPSSCDPDYNRQQITAQLVQIGTLSEPRSDLAVVSLGTKIFFAGGSSSTGYSSRIDIYDTSTQVWSTAELSIGRMLIAAITHKNKVYFAGGEIGDGTWPVDNVDIYDGDTDTWTLAHLSTAGNSIVAAAVGDRVLFAGGDGGFSGPYRETRVDILDQSTGIWTTSTLSEVKRGGHMAVTLGDKIYFAGGESWASNTAYSWFVSDEIDVYNNSTNSWSVENMYENKLSFAGIVSDSKIFWGGGRSGSPPNLFSSSLVEVWDPVLDSSTIECLYQGGNISRVVKLDDKIVFLSYPSGTFDIYDQTQDVWYYSNNANVIYCEIISNNNSIYLAGGSINGGSPDQVFLLDFDYPLSTTNTEQKKTSIYPNPVNDFLTISCPNKIQNIDFYNISGQRVLNFKNSGSSNKVQLDLKSLASGLYSAKVSTENTFENIKVIKK